LKRLVVTARFLNRGDRSTYHPVLVRRLLFPHLAIWVLGASILRVAAVPAEVCPPTTAGEVRAAAVAAGDWLVRGMSPDGRFVYGYDREQDLVSSDYNIVRHGGTTVALYQLAAQEDQRFFQPAEHALVYLMDRVTATSGDAAAVADPATRPRLGTTAFLIVALTARRDLTGDTTHDDLIRRLGRFVLGQREESGALLSLWNPDTKAPEPGQYGPFATGEAVWALTLIDRALPGEGWGESALPTLRYLASGERERSEGYLTRLPDHWAGYALSALDPELLDDELADYATRLAGYFSMRLRFESQRRGEGINLLVRWYPGPPAGVGTAGEAMGALYQLARTDDRLADLLPGMRARLACMGGFMVDRQISTVEAAADPRPGLTEGAWFYRDYTQVDGQQHVISALLGAAVAMEDDS
jgi:hypothetical protein